MKRAVISIIALLLIAATLTSCSKPAQPLTAAELLELGEKYLLELDYEQAIVHFSKLIEIEPKNPRGYAGAAEAYIGLGQTDRAIAILDQGLAQLSGNAEIQAMFDELRPLEPMVMPTPEPTPEITPEPTPSSVLPENANNFSSVLNKFSTSDVSYSFDWGNDTVNTNSLGYCQISLNISNFNESFAGALIGGWQEQPYSDDDIMRMANMMIPIWKGEGIDFPNDNKSFRQGHPVFEDELGKTIDVLLIVLDVNIDPVGHIIVSTQIPATVTTLGGVH
jgi:tetratricopeptide (TPR) repeat protein